MKKTYKESVLEVYPDAYIKEVDRKNIGGLGQGAPRSIFQIRRPVKFLFGLIKSNIIIGDSFFPFDAWYNAHKNISKK